MFTGIGTRSNAGSPRCRAALIKMDRRPPGGFNIRNWGKVIGKFDLLKDLSSEAAEIRIK